MKNIAIIIILLISIYSCEEEKQRIGKNTNLVSMILDTNNIRNSIFFQEMVEILTFKDESSDTMFALAEKIKPPKLFYVR